MMKLLSIVIILTIPLTSFGQLGDEYSRFVSDTTLTSWKEYTFSPGSNDDENYLKYTAYKDVKSRRIIKKQFSYDDQKIIDYWTITYYNVDWKIVKEIDLDSDSSIVMIEELSHLEDDIILSKYFDKYGNLDSTVKYTYFFDGTPSSYRFLYYNKNSSFHSGIYGVYKKNDQGDISELKEYDFDDKGNMVLKEYANYFYSNEQLDSILTFNKNNEVIEKEYFTYRKDKIDEIELYNYGYLKSKKSYIFNNQNFITILEKYNYYGVVRTIKIE